MGKEVRDFYGNLKGTASVNRRGINIPVVKKGSQLDNSDVRQLIAPITKAEIISGVFSIVPNKAPGLDGFNAMFFRKAWHIIQYEVCDAI